MPCPAGREHASRRVAGGKRPPLIHPPPSPCQLCDPVVLAVCPGHCAGEWRRFGCPRSHPPSAGGWARAPQAAITPGNRIRVEGGAGVGGAGRGRGGCLFGLDRSAFRPNHPLGVDLRCMTGREVGAEGVWGSGGRSPCWTIVALPLRGSPLPRSAGACELPTLRFPYGMRRSKLTQSVGTGGGRETAQAGALRTLQVKKQKGNQTGKGAGHARLGCAIRSQRGGRRSWSGEAGKYSPDCSALPRGRLAGRHVPAAEQGGGRAIDSCRVGWCPPTHIWGHRVAPPPAVCRPPAVGPARPVRGPPGCRRLLLGRTPHGLDALSAGAPG